MIDVRTVDDRERWDAFVAAQPGHTFLQSSNWGELNASMGHPAHFLGLWQNGDLVGAALTLEMHSRRGRFLFVPHGPLMPWSEDTFGALLEALRALAKERRCAWIRISPVIARDSQFAALFRNHGFRGAPIHVHAESTWTLDVRRSDEELLAGMRQTMRNSIRRAMKDGVEVLRGCDPGLRAVFCKLYYDTVERQQFTPYSAAFLDREIECFARDDRIQVYVGMYQGEALAGAIVVFYGDSGFYHHGATANIHRKVPASYLVQWEAIREARERGCAYYNFWGIAPDDRPDHPWVGLTKFKQGFGGFRTDYLHAQDLPLSPAYWLNWAVETARRIRRRY